MDGLRMAEVKQKHLGTGRLAAVVRANDFASPVSVDAGNYVLLIASEKPTVALGIKTVRAWVDAGASYICAWGPDCEQVEESFDYSSFLPEYGKELAFALMTTSHKDEPIEEALWFAFNCAKSVDPEQELNVVVIVVDSDSLETRCHFWLENNND
jgi:hypothetical protein